jgi:GNAT superfamily N-acetyltransferase
LSHPGKSLNIDILPISRQLDLESFDCGSRALNDYLQKYARQNHDRNISKTFVAVEKDGGRKALGFYTLVASEIDAQSIPTSLSKHLPRYPVPAVRIGRLGVDKRHKGRGIGGELLWDAFCKANRLSDEVGIYAVVVDAKDENAVRFYHKYGFAPLSSDPKTLYLPIETIKILFLKR